MRSLLLYVVRLVASYASYFYILYSNIFAQHELVISSGCSVSLSQWPNFRKLFDKTIIVSFNLLQPRISSYQSTIETQSFKMITSETRQSQMRLSQN